MAAEPCLRAGPLAGPRLDPLAGGPLADDLSQAPLGDQATLVHELVHVWQAQQGVRLAWAKLRAGDGPRAYRYATDETCRWDGLSIELQAMVVEHAFRLARGAPAPARAAFYRAVAPFPCGLEGG